MTKKQIVRFAIQGTVSIGAGRVVGQIIKNNTFPATKVDRILLIVGGTVIAAMIGEAVERFTLEKLQDIENAIPYKSDI